jgi:hypothetical protein
MNGQNHPPVREEESVKRGVSSRAFGGYEWEGGEAERRREREEEEEEEEERGGTNG